MPTDSDMEQDHHYHEPTSPFSGTGSLDTNNFLSHSLPAYHPVNSMHGQSLLLQHPHHPTTNNTNDINTHQTSQARSSHPVLIPTTSTSNNPNPTSHHPSMNLDAAAAAVAAAAASRGIHPGAMSFEDLLSMYYAGGNNGSVTSPGAETSMLSSLIAGQNPTTQSNDSFHANVASSGMLFLYHHRYQCNDLTFVYNSSPTHCSSNTTIDNRTNSTIYEFTQSHQQQVIILSE